MDENAQPPLLRLLAGFPVAVVERAGAGRCLVAARALRQGELVLASQPFGRTIAAPARRRWCAQCHGLSREPLRLGCRAARGACGACFCSERCRLRGAGRHGDALCAARAALRAARAATAAAAVGAARGAPPEAQQQPEAQPPPPQLPPLHSLDAECTQLALLLLDCAAQHAAQLRGLADGAGAGGDAHAEAGCAPAPPPRLFDVAAMYTPSASALAAAGLTEWAAKWAAVAAAVQAAAAAGCVAAGGAASGASDLLGGLDAAALASLASKDLSNSFGLWDRCGACAEAAHRSGGFALFPAAALLNHSCVPNVYHEHLRTPAGGALLACRALHDVAAGAELTIRYVDPGGGDAARRATFTGTWGFACACARCEAGGDAGAEAGVRAWDAAFLCGCGYARPGAGPGPGAPRLRPKDCRCTQPWLLPPREAKPQGEAAAAAQEGARPQPAAA